jgi:uncharacterized protein with PQ loop repeat
MPREFVNALSSSIEYYLPVYIPILLTLLSVVAGMLTKRISLNVRSLLKIHSDLILGLFSFIIWAFVAYQQTGKIGLNQDYSISLIRIVLLLFADFIFLIIGQIVLNIKWEEIKWLKEAEKASRVEKWANAVMLFLAVGLVFLPIFLSVKNPDVLKTDTTPRNANYRVLIPYSDESISRQIGGSRWAGRALCEINNVQAVDRDKAVEEALSVFKIKGREIPLYQFHNLPIRVVIMKESITVEKLKE